MNLIKVEDVINSSIKNGYSQEQLAIAFYCIYDEGLICFEDFKEILKLINYIFKEKENKKNEKN